jgi:hypothetical protein
MFFTIYHYNQALIIINEEAENHSCHAQCGGLATTFFFLTKFIILVKP